MPRKSSTAARPSRKPTGTTRARTTTRRASTSKLPAGICRVDQQSTRTFGYVVRLGHVSTPRGWRPKFTAYFGDFTYGGKKDALAAAERWARIVNRTGRAPARK